MLSREGVVTKVKNDVTVNSSGTIETNSQINPNQLPSREEWRTDQQINNSVLLTAIRKYNDRLFEDALDLAELDAIGVPGINNITSDAPPITIAICEYNRHALTRLLEKGAKIDTRDENGTLPMAFAVAMGDSEMVQTLLRFKAKLNYLSARGTALHSILQNVTGYSLLKTAKWDGDDANEKLANDLMDWFEGIEPKPAKSISGTFYGNLDLLQLILQMHPEFIYNNEEDKPQPLQIAQNPKLLADKFRDAEGNPIQCKAGTDGILILSNFQIFNRDMSQSIVVKELRFDFAEIRKAIYAIATPNAVSRQHIDAIAAKVTASIAPTVDAKLAAHAAATASATAAATEARAAASAAKNDVANLKTAVEKNQKETTDKVDALNKKTSPSTSDHAAKQCYATRIKTVLDPINPSRKHFFNQINKPLDAMLSGYKLLSSALFKQESANALDYAADAFNGLSGCVPAPFSTALSLAEKLTQFYSDRKKLAKHTAIRDLLPKSPAECTENVALELSEWLDNYFMGLSQDEADILAKKVRGVILAKLYGEADSLNADEPLAKQLIHTVQTSKFFNDHILQFANKALAARRTKILAVPSHKTLYEQVQTRLLSFWEEFSSSFARTANSKAGGDLGLLLESLESKLHPILPRGKTVRTVYSDYLGQMTAGDKVRTLNPLSLQQLAITLTEMVTEHATKQKADLSTLKHTTDLKTIANNVATHAINSLFTSLCVNESNDNENIQGTQPAAAVTTNFNMSAVANDNTQAILNDLRQNPALITYLSNAPLLNPAKAKAAVATGNTNARVAPNKVDIKKAQDTTPAKAAMAAKAPQAPNAAPQVPASPYSPPGGPAITHGFDSVRFLATGVGHPSHPDTVKYDGTGKPVAGSANAAVVKAAAKYPEPPKVIDANKKAPVPAPVAVRVVNAFG